MRVCGNGDNFRASFVSGDWRQAYPRSRPARRHSPSHTLVEARSMKAKEQESATAARQARRQRRSRRSLPPASKPMSASATCRGCCRSGPDEIADESIAGRRRIVAPPGAGAAGRAQSRPRRALDLRSQPPHRAAGRPTLAERRWLDGGAEGVARKRKPPAAGPPAAELRTDRRCLRTCGGAAGRGPSSWRAPSGRRRSSARPSDSRRPGPTSRGILPATGRNGCAGGASAT